jgi:hypothetical protein
MTAESGMLCPGSDMYFKRIGDMFLFWLGG